tara:strand:+ start:1533 stop:3041 length:1509 start_codon:yes stop_codon:yes gene_type:complete
MKLLRLTTTDPNAVFDETLNTDLKIEPYSQIALSNASFTNEFKDLTLTSATNTITFNNSSGSKSADLTLATYSGTESGSLALFDDMERQLNKKLVLTDGKDFGGRFSVKSINGKNRIAYLISPLIFADFDTNGNIQISGDTGDPDRIVSTTDNVVTNDVNRLSFASPLVPGAGVFRTQVNNLVSLGAGSPATTGGYRMILGPLSTNNPGSIIPSEQEKYMVGIVPDETDNTLYKYVFRDGTGTTKDLLDGSNAKIRPSTPTQDASGNASVTNDTLDLIITGGNVKGFVYRNGATIEAFSSAYDGSDLYGIMVIRGGDSNEGAGKCLVQNPRYTEKDSLPGIDQRVGHLAAAPQPPLDRQATFTLDLSGCQPLADFLGFDVGSNNYVYSRPNYTSLATFTSESGLTLGASDSYIVQFMSVPLDSYDTFEGGEFSILKVIPNLNQTSDQRKCNYEASNLHFIDLKNSQPQTLRNIKARILTDELRPISTVHMSSITVLIKSKDE